MKMPTPEDVMAQIESSTQLRDHTISVSRKLVEDYRGRFHRDDRKPERPQPIPHAFEWIAQITPLVVYDNPRIEVGTLASSPREDLVRIKHGVNKWSEKTNCWWQYLMVWYDLCFSFGAMGVSLVPVPGYPGAAVAGEIIKPHWPKLFRISPRHFVQDPNSSVDPMNPKWRGHMWNRTRDELLADPSYNPQAINAIAADSHADEYYGKEGGYDRRPGDEIIGYDVWFRDLTLPGFEGDDKFNGTVVTLAMGWDARNERMTKARWIRDPYPFHGPPEGPYELFGIYHVPDEVYPLSPLAATRDQVQAMNAHADAAARQAGRAKSFTAVDAAHDQTARIIKNVKDGDVIKVPGLANNIMQAVTMGGADPKVLEMLDRLTARVERSTGLNDAARGLVRGTGTATEQATAAAARNDRVSYMVKRYQTHACNMLKRVAWYMRESTSVDFELGDAAAAELHPRPKWLPPESDADDLAMEYETQPADPNDPLSMLPLAERGDAIRKSLRWQPRAYLRAGSNFPQGDETFDELQITISPMSMERASEPMQQKRALDWVNLIISVTPLIRQFPEIDWIALLDQVGQTINKKDAGDIINIELAKQLSGLAMQPQQPQQPPQGGAPAPGFSPDQFVARAQETGAEAAPSFV